MCPCLPCRRPEGGPLRPRVCARLWLLHPQRARGQGHGLPARVCGLPGGLPHRCARRRLLALRVCQGHSLPAQPQSPSSALGLDLLLLSHRRRRQVACRGRVLQGVPSSNWHSFCALCTYHYFACHSALPHAPALCRRACRNTRSTWRASWKTRQKRQQTSKEERRRQRAAAVAAMQRLRPPRLSRSSKHQHRSDVCITSCRRNPPDVSMYRRHAAPYQCPLTQWCCVVLPPLFSCEDLFVISPVHL